jgi:hypothetical protein
MEVCGEVHSAVALSPGKEPQVTIGYEVGVPRVGVDATDGRNLSLAGNRTPEFQHLAHHCTD